MKAKRIAAIMLALSMTVGAFAGCGGDTATSSKAEASSAADDTTSVASTADTDGIEIVNGTYVTGLPIAAEDITLQICVERHSYDQTKSYNEKAAFKNVYDETGINIDWMELAAGTASEKVPLMLASDDLPDIFYGNMVGDTTIMQYEESFVPMEDYLETYAPNTLATYEQLTAVDWKEYLTTTSGHIYGFLTRFNSLKEQRFDGIQMINKTWLEQVGMDIPTTTDELYEVLKAFKGVDFNGDGVTNEIPFLISDQKWSDNLDCNMGWWGIGQGSGSYFQVRDGEVQGMLVMDEYRQFLEYFHMLYSEGLINADFASLTSDTLSALIKEGKVGTYYGWSILSNLPIEEVDNWATVPTLTAIEGVKPVANGEEDRPTINRNQYVITTACDHVEAAIRLWDHWSRDAESKLTVLYGEKGILWDEYEDGGYYFVVPEDVSEEFSYENMKYTYGLVNHAPVLTEEETPVNDPSISPEAALRDSMVDEVLEYAVPKDEQMPTSRVSAEATERLTFITTDLSSYIAEARSQFVINGVTDEEWEAYKQHMQDLKYDEYIQWYQDYYDGNLE